MTQSRCRGETVNNVTQSRCRGETVINVIEGRCRGTRVGGQDDDLVGKSDRRVSFLPG